MWLVKIALSRPYTFIVFALLLLMTGTFAILRMPTDIFPNINIPVVSVVWNYAGMPPEEMANRITAVFERAVTSTVNDIEHMDSQSLIGVSVTKLYFQPGVKIAVALAQITAISQTLLKLLPPGALPPLILSYNAASVPAMQLVLSSATLPEQVLNDLGTNYIRTQLATVQGAAMPFPYGGKTRQIVVDLDSKAMQAYGVSAQNVNRAMNAQSVIVPAGTEKIGIYEYFVKLNNNLDVVGDLNMLPVKTTPNRILYMRDVAHVRDGFAPQTNIVRVDGERAVMISVQKTGEASTLNIINRVKAMLPLIRDNLPEAIRLGIFGDQSIFVMAAIHSVLMEALIAAVLTGLMILFFLGSWRSTLIISISIPLSILASLTMLAMLGQTLNIMTLGGLALAVGILVDDATVTIENINWHLEKGKSITQAILDGADQIAMPAFVSTLCICIVFIPMFFLDGVAQYLFIPFAEAVMFAMLASYFLSRTLVPTLAYYLLPHVPAVGGASADRLEAGEPLDEARFNHYFEQFRAWYRARLVTVLTHASLFVRYFMGGALLILLCLWSWLGTDFFPAVDAGQIKLHVRAPNGTRVEETARLVDQVDQVIKQEISEKAIAGVIDNIGLPISGTNLTYSNSGTVGPEDADILIALKPHHAPLASIIAKLRVALMQAFPGVSFSFLPADIVNQILNFGLPSAINLQVSGSQMEANARYVGLLLEKLAHIPGVVDVRTRQGGSYPELFVNVDRSRAKELGFSFLDVASSVLLSLSGSLQVTPNFWIDPKNGVSYPIVTQVPQYAMNSLQTLKNIPITNIAMDATPQTLGAMSTISRRGAPAVVSHYNVQPLIDVFADLQGRDLGGVTKEVNQLVKDMQPLLPKGSQVLMRGQAQTQQRAFKGLYIGLIFSIVLVYLLIVVNFQSWLDPFIIISALPIALAGIVVILFITHMTLSVPALTGAIMCMGVATANSILVVSFAREQLAAGKSVFDAVLEAGVTRVRPVLMTALAMILGMLPMSLGLGVGGEQNAPLGRAVVGGLSFATIATLLFVPAVFYLIHRREET